MCVFVFSWVGIRAGKNEKLKLNDIVANNVDSEVVLTDNHDNTSKIGQCSSL